MGIVSSAFLGIQLCFSRVSSWGLCACILSVMMMVMILLIIYGMTIGYHTAQTELVQFSLKARGIKRVLKYDGPLRRSGMKIELRDKERVITTTTTLRTEPTTNSMLGLELYDTRPPTNAGSAELTETPVFIHIKDRLPTEETIQAADAVPRKFVGRFRRAKDFIFLKSPFWRPLRKHG